MLRNIYLCRKFSKFTFEKEIEAFTIEINLRKIKWLLVYSYNPTFYNLSLHLNTIDKAIEFYSKTYDKILIAGDFNAEVRGIKLDTFCSIWNLKSLGKEPICFKNPNNPSCIALFLTNTIRSSQQTQVFQTGLSDFHKLIVTVLKSIFPKSLPKLIKYRSCKNFSNDLFRDNLNFLLSKENITLEFTSLRSFPKILIDTLNKHAPIKKKYIRANRESFVTKDLRKTIMLRSRLPNIFFKEKSLGSKKAYNKQRNICVKMVKKTKKEHFQNINLSEIAYNKKFWKTASPLFDNKIKTNQKINLTEKKLLVTSDAEIAKTFKEYFDDIVPKLNMIQNECYMRKTRNIEDPVKNII